MAQSPFWLTATTVLSGIAAGALTLAAGWFLVLLALRVRALSGRPLWPLAGEGGRLLAALSQYGGKAASVPANLALPRSVRSALAVLRRPSPLLLLPLLGGAVLGLVSRDAVLFVYLTCLGAVLTFYLAYRRTLAGRQRLADDVRRLIEAFAALYRVTPATFAALELAVQRLSAGDVRQTVEGAVHEYAATRNTQAALRSFFALGDPYLSRFALILSRANDQPVLAGGAGGTDELARLVDDLARRLRARWLMRLTAQGVFSTVRGTLTVIAGAISAAAGAAVTVPLWRDAYLPERRPMYVALTLAAAVAGLYFDRRMRLDEEALL